MTAIHVDWPSVCLGDITTMIRNGLFASRPTDEPVGGRILRISAVRRGKVDLNEHRYVQGVSDEKIQQFALRPGELLITRYNGSRHLVGISGIVPDHNETILYPDKLIRVALNSDIADSRFINYQLQSPRIREFLEPRIRTTAGQSGISGRDVRALPMLLPALADQYRVVEFIEHGLSRIDAVRGILRSSNRRLSALQERAVADGVLGSGLDDFPLDHFIAGSAAEMQDMVRLPAGWVWRTLGDVADVAGGITKDSKRQNDPNYIEVPYLRVANVQRGFLDLREISKIRVAASKADALLLRDGDVLLNEGGDRDKLARGWVWQDQIDSCIHQNHVFRARMRPNVMDPYFLSLFVNAIGGKWAERHGRQSVNLASISLSTIRKMPVPVPPIGIQSEIARRLLDQRVFCERIRRAIRTGMERCDRMEKSVLATAFGGQFELAFNNSRELVNA